MEYSNKWSADAEMVMMGFTLPVESEDHLKYLLDYFKSPCGFEYNTEEIISNSKQFCGDPNKISFKHINLCSIEGMRMIAITMTTEEDEGGEPYNLLSKNGCFGYVYNIDCPYCSELGYSYYANKIGRIVRIG